MINSNEQIIWVLLQRLGGEAILDKKELNLAEGWNILSYVGADGSIRLKAKVKFDDLSKLSEAMSDSPVEVKP